VLRDFDGRHHHRTVERFRKADADHIDSARKHIIATLEAKLPRAGDAAAASSEPGILKRELAKKTKHKALRKLLSEIPNLLSRLKPCLLMSPLSVAQYLPATGRRFDIVVFDEASQIGPHDAIGAIARGGQVVIVGDSKQLPPTTFFQKSAEDDGPVDDNAVEDMESILDQALASNMPEQMLGWHYRSRHESLIEFSNIKYYDTRLHIFPAARGRVPDLGVKFHHIGEGVYDAGKTRQNALEAAAVVAELVRNLRSYAPTERTFGVVTFSATQQELIENLLLEERERFPEIEPHFAEDHPQRGEKVFIKNLETVQGDERDEVFFSIGYGPDAQGKLVMNFGPLNRDGGERRLNVAVTRARMQLRVFSSIKAGDIDTNRTKAKGSADLKAFLRFAEDRMLSSLDTNDEPSGDFDSDFERDVYDVLRASGHRVHTQVGCGGYRIDLAVSHPKQKGVFALGIECDGAAYHSGPTARDRDRLRPSVLEGLGWKLHRIWSTDWVYERQREMKRVEEAIEAACSAEPAAAKLPSVAPVRIEMATPAPEERVSGGTRASGSAGTPTPPVERGSSPMIPYQKARLDPVSSRPEDIYGTAYRAHLGDHDLRTLSAEAPVHVDELTRRVVTAFGGGRISDRSRRRVLEAIPASSYVLDGEFVWERSVDRRHWTDVRVPPAGEDTRDTELIALEEIAAAARWVLASNLSLDVDDLVRQTARVFRIQRLGQKVEDRVRQAVALLAQQGLCEERAGRVEWRGQS
jgi:very-short-patch-repair endonuclease